MKAWLMVVVGGGGGGGDGDEEDSKMRALTAMRRVSVWSIGTVGSLGVSCHLIYARCVLTFETN